MTIYVASPLGFAESTRQYLAELLELLKRRGLDPFDPWSQGHEKLIEEAYSLGRRNGTERNGLIAKLHEVNIVIARSNENAIRSADYVLAVLDGADVDSGTASEVGFAYALGKTIFGLRTDFRMTGDNEGAIVNLQVQHWIEESGGSILRSLQELDTALASGIRNPARS